MLKNIVPNEKPTGAGVSSNRAQYSNDLFADEAITYLDAHKSAGKAGGGSSFFLYLPFTIPHANNEATPHGTEVPDPGLYAATDWPDVEKGYAAMVTRLDGYVGRIGDKLKEVGLDDNTLVIFTSDNGAHHEGGHGADFFRSGGPLRGTKRDLTEGGIREPFIARWPGHTHAGTESDLIGSFQDVLATCADLAGVAAADLPKTDGVSIVPSIVGRPGDQAKHDYLYWEFFEGVPAQAVRR